MQIVRIDRYTINSIVLFKLHVVLWYFVMSVYSSFPVIRRVSNVGIFVQLLIEINWKQLRAKSISMQSYICHRVELKLNRLISLLNWFQILKIRKCQLCELRKNSISRCPRTRTWVESVLCFVPISLWMQVLPTFSNKLCKLLGYLSAHDFVCVHVN